MILHPTNLNDDSRFSVTREDALLNIVDQTISLTSKRKLVHVISPFVDEQVSKTETNPSHEQIPRTLLGGDQVPSDQSLLTAPMSMAQLAVLCSIRRARGTFHKYLAMRRLSEQKKKVLRSNVADDSAPETTYKSDQAMSSPKMEYFAFEKIELVCAVLSEEMSPLKNIMERICDRIVLLPRSTKTEYGTNRSLPFLQDILDTSQEPIYRADNTTIQNQQNDDDFYLFSNADIGLSQNFYIHLDSQVKKRHASALSINRMTLDLEITANSKDAMTLSWDSASRFLKQTDDLIEANQFRLHPGYDCFLFHSSVLKRIHFGDFFVGFPPFGANVHLALLIMAPNYANLASHPNGTFHLGNDRNWQTSKQQSITESYDHWTKFRNDLYYLPWCPISNHPPPNDYAMQNSINCGQWFHPNRKWPSNHPKSSYWPWQRPSDSFPIPAFVREGSEALYIRNYGKYLNYTRDGMPIVSGHQTPEIKRRRPKVVMENKRRWKEDGLVGFTFHRLLQTLASFSM
ncbi:unnamed protein product [Cylindrotheca closterium]|uniref:Uncharacterized protein n=1 Tax=Cylindrotheca closterium TaxID=2856 RepID=A0AAD2JPJ9_9STRA|nr:unnamed protein product [Cylindrotheca closterium]